MDKSRQDAYLARIGAARPAGPDAAALRGLQHAHLATVPFENLSIHLGEPIVLEEDALLDKIVDRRRGGFCYELNGAFAALLTALGYRVSLLSARVFGENGPGHPMDHMALRVELDEPWLVDVGFGRFADFPLRLDTRAGQRDPSGVYEVTGHGTWGDLDIARDGAPQYRLDPRPYALADFAPTCWWQRTSPDSHFTRSPTCSLPTPAGRVTLAGTRLITTTGGARHEETLDDAALLTAYRELFGLPLDRLPDVPAAR